MSQNNSKSSGFKNAFRGIDQARLNLNSSLDKAGSKAMNRMRGKKDDDKDDKDDEYSGGANPNYGLSGRDMSHLPPPPRRGAYVNESAATAMANSIVSIAETSSTPVDINSVAEFSNVINTDTNKVILACFVKSKDPKCLELNSVFEYLASQSQCIVLMIDITAGKNGDIVSFYSISSVPTIYIAKNKQIVEDISSTDATPDNIQTVIRKYIPYIIIPADIISRAKHSVPQPPPPPGRPNQQLPALPPKPNKPAPPSLPKRPSTASVTKASPNFILIHSAQELSEKIEANQKPMFVLFDKVKTKTELLNQFCSDLNAELLFIDADDNEVKDLLDYYDINAYPTLFFIRNKDIVEEWTGSEMTENSIKEKTSSYISQPVHTKNTPPPLAPKPSNTVAKESATSTKDAPPPLAPKPSSVVDKEPASSAKDATVSELEMRFKSMAKKNSDTSDASSEMPNINFSTKPNSENVRDSDSIDNANTHILDLGLNSGWYTDRQRPPVLDSQKDVVAYSSSGSRSMLEAQLVGVVAWNDLSKTYFRITWNPNNSIGSARSLQHLESKPANLSKALLEDCASFFGPQLIQWAREHDNQIVGRGECWDLVDLGLKNISQNNPQRPVMTSVGLIHGHLIQQFPLRSNSIKNDDIRLGDVLQFKEAVFVTVDESTGSTVTKYAGSPDHTAIIVGITNQSVDVLEQNPGPVHAGSYTLNDLQKGTLHVYRPVDQSWYGELVPKWHSDWK